MKQKKKKKRLRLRTELEYLHEGKTSEEKKCIICFLDFAN